MSRWAHTVVVRADVWSIPYLACSCGWISKGMREPTVTRLAEAAQDHRRSVSAAETVSRDGAARPYPHGDERDDRDPYKKFQTRSHYEELARQVGES